MATITSKPSGNTILAQHWDLQSSTARYPVGLEIPSDDGCVFKYMLAGEALTGQSYVIIENATTGVWSLATETLALAGGLLGVVATNGAVTNAYYFWGCIVKPSHVTTFGVRTDANVAASRNLKVSGTSGQLVAGTTTESVVLSGVGLRTATPTTAAATNTACWFDRMTKARNF